ncbi:MAG: adenylyltransferase/cytidyltransferase family protein [Verrucomicrobiota bacterium]|jgi:cytidyltransferase-like protein
MNAKQVVVTGVFDDIRSEHIRFLEEASRVGELTVLLWGDDLLNQRQGRPPKFPEAERLYFLQAIRFVQGVHLITKPFTADTLPEVAGLRPNVWAVGNSDDTAAKRTFCAAQGLQYHLVRDDDLRGFPDSPALHSTVTGRKKVVVTGSYDWFHSGHVRFFEEVSAYGDLYVIVGHDANIRLLKGAGHPLLPEGERRYVVGSIKYVKQALISSGNGWLDADPEIRQLKPDIYAVNEDGDKGGKREYCQKNGIQYLVLKRTPASGLPERSSTLLRGF